MGKSIVLLLVLIVLTALCMITVSPVLSSAAVGKDSWASKAPMQVARGSLGVAVVNGRIYAIGGSTQSGQWPNFRGGTVGTNEEYDPETDMWTFKMSMPTPRHYFATAVYQNKIYCIGGYTSNGTVTGLNEVYDPETDTWENKTPMPTARISLQANAANGKIYLTGGYVPAYYTTYNFSNSALNEAYDPTTDSWTIKTPMPIAASGYASVAVDNKIYIIGGLSNSSQANLNQIYNLKLIHGV